MTTTITGGNEWGSHLRRSAVDILGAAATVAVALAAIDTADVLYLLWIAVAVVGIGFMLEPRVTAQTQQTRG